MFYGPECVLSWGIFHVSLKAVCILLFLDGVFYKCQLDQLIDHSGQLYPSECSAHLIYQFLKRCVKVSTIILHFSISPQSSVNFCLTNFDALLLGTYILELCLLENEVFYYYVVPLFTPDNFSCSDVCFVWI